MNDRIVAQIVGHLLIEGLVDGVSAGWVYSTAYHVKFPRPANETLVPEVKTLGFMAISRLVMDQLMVGMTVFDDRFEIWKLSPSETVERIEAIWNAIDPTDWDDGREFWLVNTARGNEMAFFALDKDAKRGDASAHAMLESLARRGGLHARRFYSKPH